jgi:disulfide bond formation protein DsbB
MTLSSRLANFAGAIVCALLLAYAYYLQYHDGLEPCPLCIFQRLIVCALGVWFLLAALQNPGRTGARVYAGLLVATALTGVGVAARHIYIQSLPEGSVPACGATLDYMIEIFPVSDVIKKVLTGSGECHKIDWRFLGLTMPMCMLVAFTGLGAAGLAVNWKKKDTGS